MANQLSNLKPWPSGQSGNPNGRPKSAVDIAELARKHGPRCIEVAAKLLNSRDERIRLAAVVALLDRGFGRPLQTLANEDGSSPILLHLVATELVGKELLAERAAQQPPTIQHEPTRSNGHASALDETLPLE